MKIALSFLFQFAGVLAIKINSFRYGHTLLYWYPTGSPEKFQRIPLEGDFVILSGFANNDEYSFFTTNPETSEQSEIMTTRIIIESSDEYTTKLKHFISEIEDSDMVAEVFDSLSDINFIRGNIISETDYCPLIAMQKFYTSIKSPEIKELKTCAKIIRAIERYVNMQNITMNKDSQISIGIECNCTLKLKFIYGIDSIVVFSLDDGIPIFNRKISVMSHDWIDVILPQNNLYLIHCYAGSDLVYNLYHYQFDENMTAYLWQNQNLISQKMSNAMKNNIEMGNISLEFTDEELNFYKKEIAINPTDYLIGRPVVEDIFQGKIYLRIDDWSPLPYMNKKFYLTIKPDDLLFSRNCENSVLITDTEIEFNYSSTVVDGNNLFYITDENGRMISKMTRYSFDESEQSRIEDYNIKFKDIEYREYLDRLSKVVKLRIPQALSTVESLIEDIQSNESVQAENIWIELISKINQNYYNFDKMLLFYAILEEYNNKFAHDLNFFADPVVYNPQIDLLAFATRNSSYILTSVTMNEFDENLQITYTHSRNNTIDIKLDEYNYCFLYAIDLENYIRSGFIAVERIKNQSSRILTSNIQIKGR